MYLIVIPEMADLDMFLHVHMIKVLSHPPHVTPVEIPFSFTAPTKIGGIS